MKLNRKRKVNSSGRVFLSKKLSNKEVSLHEVTYKGRPGFLILEEKEACEEEEGCNLTLEDLVECKALDRRKSTVTKVGMVSVGRAWAGSKVTQYILKKDNYLLRVFKLAANPEETGESDSN